MAISGANASSRGDEPSEPTVRLPDWSELVASYSLMKSAWGWANGGQPILVCYIRKYVIILGGYSRWRPPNQNIGGCVPGGVDASDGNRAKTGNVLDFHAADARWGIKIISSWLKMHSTEASETGNYCFDCRIAQDRYLVKNCTVLNQNVIQIVTVCQTYSVPLYLLIWSKALSWHWITTRGNSQTHLNGQHWDPIT